MDWSTITTVLSLLCGGGLLGLIGKIVNMGMKYQELLSRVQSNEARDEEERKANAEKFAELYNSRNKTNEALVEVNTTLKMMLTSIDQQFVNLNNKIDEIKKEQKHDN